MDCPNNVDKKPNATLNVVSTIPSSGSEEESKVSVKVVTRAQRKQAKGQIQEESNPDQCQQAMEGKTSEGKGQARGKVKRCNC